MKIRTTSLTAAACLLILVFVPLSGAIVSNDTRDKAGPRLLMDHGPIVISSDADFATQAASEPWSGSGTEGDPYIIQGYRINASTHNYGIHISGTSVHFMVQSCHILDTSSDMVYGTGTGIRFYDVQHGTVKYLQVMRSKNYGISIQDSENITIDNTTVIGSPDAEGFYIRSSNGITVTGCVLRDNECGMLLEESQGSIMGCSITRSIYNGIELYRASGWKIEDNTIEDASEMGIYLRSGSVNNEFHRNVFINCSFGMYGSIMVFTTNHIPTDNTVNGLPVHQIKDHAGSGEELSISSGQLILGNVSDIVVRGMNISKASQAMIVGHCSRVTVIGCNLSNDEIGLGMIGGDNNTVEQCVFMDCDRAGTMMEETRDGTVRNCYLKGGEMGLCTGDNLYRLNAHDNRIEGSEIGIYLGGAIGARVHNNTIAGSSEHGLYLEYVFDSHVEGNRIDDGPIMASPGKGISANHLYDTMIRDNLVLHTDIGMDMKETFDCHIMNNTVDSALNEGARFDGSDNCTIVGNLFYRNGGLGVTMVSDHGPTMDDLVWGNSYLFNNGATTVYQPGRYQAQDASSFNNWTSQSEGKGNHWSDWTAPDDDGDGTVDVPYMLEGGKIDLKPLVMDPLLHATPPVHVKARSMRDSVNISWEGPAFTRSGQISGYRIFKAERGHLPSLLIELPSSARYYIDSELDSGAHYNYSVQAYNIYGNGAMSKDMYAIPDSTPPELIIFAPQDGSFWNVTSVRASWEGSDNVGVTGHRYRMDQSPWTEMGMVNETFVSDLSEGDHLLEVECFDELNNTASASTTFHVDLTAPEVEITGPQEGLITASGSMMVEWVGEDLPYSVRNYRWRLDGSLWESTNDTSARLGPLSNGLHTFHVEAFDMAGNMGYDSITFTVDTISPVVVVLTPSEGEVISGKPILASWTANGTGSSITGLRTKLDSGPWREIGIAYNETLMGLEKGNHTYWVSATDGAGNSGTASVSFRVASEIPEPPGPGKGLILGRVLDKNGDPVHMVKVRSDKGEETFTDSEGYFFIEVEAGRRTLTFSRKGYRTYDRIIEVTENGTVQMDPVAMEERSDEKRAGLEWWYFCLCCLLPFVILLLMFMVIGAMARIRRSRRRKLDEE